MSERIVSNDRVLLPSTVARHISGFSRQHLQRLLQEKRIEGIKLSRDWLVYEDFLQAYLAQPRKPDQRDHGKNLPLILPYPILPTTMRIDLKIVEAFSKVVYLHDGWISDRSVPFLASMELVSMATYATKRAEPNHRLTNERKRGSGHKVTWQTSCIASVTKRSLRNTGPLMPIVEHG